MILLRSGNLDVVHNPKPINAHIRTATVNELAACSFLPFCPGHESERLTHPST